jgi:hypothetical protein
MFKKVVSKILTGLLTVAMVAATTLPAFAAERPVPSSGTPEYADFMSKTPQEQMEYIAGGKNTPEYRQFITMYIDRLLERLPTEPEDALTYLSVHNDNWSWEMFYADPRG